MNDLAKLIYSLLIGVAVAVVAGMSIAALNPGPNFPGPSSYVAEPSQEQMKKEQANYKNFEREYAKHSRDSSMIALAASVAIFLIGLAVLRSKRLNEVISDGVLLGGLFTAIYAAIRSVGNMYPTQGADPGRWLSVLAAVVALGMAIVIAQVKFSPASPKVAKGRK